MANYIAYARSNYFKVKDEEKFKNFIRDFDLTLIKDEVNGEFLCGFLTDEYGITDQIYNEETDEFEEVDFIKELSKHIADGYVAIVQQVGYENYRYFTGYAIAVNNKDERLIINLSDITDLAKEKWGSEVTVTDPSY
jgi:hypothetical protein